MHELKALHTFLLAAERKSFAQVARELGVTPASVTRTIAALEEELGVQLFVRTTRTVSLTSDGASFAARIAPAVRSLQEARADILNAHKADEGLLRINAPMSLGQKVLPQIIGWFRKLYPKIDVQIVLTDHFLDVVEEDFDLAVRVSGPPSDKFTIWRKICVVRRILVAAPGTPWARVTHPSELPADACLAFSGDSRSEQWQLSDGKSRYTVDAGQCISANNGEVLGRFAADGSGVALLPTFIVAELLRQGRLVRVLPQWHPPELWLTLFYPPYHALPPRIATFSSFFEAHIGRLVTELE